MNIRIVPIDQINAAAYDRRVDLHRVNCLRRHQKETPRSTVTDLC
ncbi:hypothetical protein [Paenibacillus illinoisensis]